MVLFGAQVIFVIGAPSAELVNPRAIAIAADLSCQSFHKNAPVFFVG